jgi:hypothetical protein
MYPLVKVLRDLVMSLSLRFGAGHHPLVPRVVIEDALRYAKYATAVYGTTFYTWMLKKRYAEGVRAHGRDDFGARLLSEEAKM